MYGIGSPTPFVINILHARRITQPQRLKMDIPGDSGDDKPSYLVARFQIGSCKGPTSYAPAETVFHPDDIPFDKKANKNAVAKWKRTGACAQPPCACRAAAFRCRYRQQRLVSRRLPRT
jgi:hypothetical protein